MGPLELVTTRSGDGAGLAQRALLDLEDLESLEDPAGQLAQRGRPRLFVQWDQEDQPDPADLAGPEQAAIKRPNETTSGQCDLHDVSPDFMAIIISHYQQRVIHTALHDPAAFATYRRPETAPRLPSCLATFIRCPRGSRGVRGARTDVLPRSARRAVASGHVKKEEPRAGGGSRFLSLDLFELCGGVSVDGGAARPS